MAWEDPSPRYKPTPEQLEVAAKDAPMLPDLPYRDRLGRPPSPLNPKVPCCWAKLKRGRLGRYGDGRCHDVAMFNGREFTRCPRHGGKAGRPPSNGQRTQKLVGKRIFEMAEELENDRQLTAIEEQVKIGAALFMEYIEGLNKAECDFMDAGEIDKALDRLEKVSKLTERRHKIREGQLYTVRTEHVILAVHAVVDVINDELGDFPELKERLARRIANIRVIEGTSRPAKAINA